MDEKDAALWWYNQILQGNPQVNFRAQFQALRAYAVVKGMTATCSFCARPRTFGEPHINCGIIARVDWGHRL